MAINDVHRIPPQPITVPITITTNSVFLFDFGEEWPLIISEASLKVVPTIIYTIEPGTIPTILRQKSLNFIEVIPTTKLRMPNGTIGDACRSVISKKPYFSNALSIAPIIGYFDAIFLASL